jgi:hypothetical protein
VRRVSPNSNLRPRHQQRAKGNANSGETNHIWKIYFEYDGLCLLIFQISHICKCNVCEARRRLTRT